MMPMVFIEKNQKLSLLYWQFNFETPAGTLFHPASEFVNFFQQLSSSPEPHLTA
jgi:hypothetical protein